MSTRRIDQGTTERIFSDELRWRARVMTGKAQPLYLDEAGFTGNNLLDPEQPAFVYAGVAMDKEHAARLHSDALSRFRINAQKLKRATLLNPNPPMRSGLGARTRGEGRGTRRSALDSDKWGRWRPLVVVGGADGGPGQRRCGGVGGTVCRGRQSRTGPVRLCGVVG